MEHARTFFDPLRVSSPPRFPTLRSSRRLFVNPTPNPQLSPFNDGPPPLVEDIGSYAPSSPSTIAPLTPSPTPSHAQLSAVQYSTPESFAYGSCGSKTSPKNATGLPLYTTSPGIYFPNNDVRIHNGLYPSGYDLPNSKVFCSTNEAPLPDSAHASWITPASTQGCSTTFTESQFSIHGQVSPSDSVASSRGTVGPSQSSHLGTDIPPYSPSTVEGRFDSFDTGAYSTLYSISRFPIHASESASGQWSQRLGMIQCQPQPLQTPAADSDGSYMLHFQQSGGCEAAAMTSYQHSCAQDALLTLSQPFFSSPPAASLPLSSDSEINKFYGFSNTFSSSIHSESADPSPAANLDGRNCSTPVAFAQVPGSEHTYQRVDCSKTGCFDGMQPTKYHSESPPSSTINTESPAHTPTALPPPTSVNQHQIMLMGAGGSGGNQKVAKPNVHKAARRRRKKEGKYVCSHCQDTFTERHGLKNHVLVHLGIRPFSCSGCKKAFTTAGTCKRHCKTCRSASATPTQIEFVYEW